MVRSCYVHSTADPELQGMNKHNNGVYGKVVEAPLPSQDVRSYRVKPSTTPSPAVDEEEMDIDAVSVSTDEIPATPSPKPKRQRRCSTSSGGRGAHMVPGYVTPPATIPARKFTQPHTASPPRVSKPSTPLITPARTRTAGPPFRDPRQQLVRRAVAKQTKTAKAAAAAPSTRHVELLRQHEMRNQVPHIITIT